MSAWRPPRAPPASDARRQARPRPRLPGRRATRRLGGPRPPALLAPACSVPRSVRPDDSDFARRLGVLNQTTRNCRMGGPRVTRRRAGVVNDTHWNKNRQKDSPKKKKQCVTQAHFAGLPAPVAGCEPRASGIVPKRTSESSIRLPAVLADFFFLWHIYRALLNDGAPSDIPDARGTPASASGYHRIGVHVAFGSPCRRGCGWLCLYLRCLARGALPPARGVRRGAGGGPRADPPAKAGAARAGARGRGAEGVQGGPPPDGRPSRRCAGPSVGPKNLEDAPGGARRQIRCEVRPGGGREAGGRA